MMRGSASQRNPKKAEESTTKRSEALAKKMAANKH